MNPTALTVVAHLEARPGKEAELREILTALVDPTRQEEGCINYDLYESNEHPGRFLFHENWNGQADLDRHLKSPHVTAALTKVGPLVAEAPVITTWRRVA